MSKSLKDSESLHTDQHDANFNSPVVSSSDEAGQKMIKLEITHMMSQQRGYQKNEKLPHQVSKISNSSQGKEKEIPPHQTQR